MAEQEFGSYPLGRKFRWLFYHAAQGFQRRVLECQRCGTKEDLILKDVFEAARQENRFVRKHSKCLEHP